LSSCPHPSLLQILQEKRLSRALVLGSARSLCIVDEAVNRSFQGRHLLEQCRRASKIINMPCRLHATSSKKNAVSNT
jgi:hypothetical protein